MVGIRANEEGERVGAKREPSGIPDQTARGRSLTNGIHPPLARYGIAVAAVGLALVIKLLLDPLIGEETPFLLFFAAVMAVAFFCGPGPRACSDRSRRLGRLVLLFVPALFVSARELRAGPALGAVRAGRDVHQPLVGGDVLREAAGHHQYPTSLGRSGKPARERRALPLSGRGQRSALLLTRLPSYADQSGTLGSAPACRLVCCGRARGGRLTRAARRGPPGSGEGRARVLATGT